MKELNMSKSVIDDVGVESYREAKDVLRPHYEQLLIEVANLISQARRSGDSIFWNTTPKPICIQVYDPDDMEKSTKYTIHPGNGIDITVLGLKNHEPK